MKIVLKNQLFDSDCSQGIFKLPMDLLTRRSWLVGSGAIALSVFGCGGGGANSFPRAKVRGRVTYQGKPVPYGYLNLYPSGGANLPMSTTQISDGQYEFNEKGGVAVGEYRVEITGWDSPPEKVDRHSATTTPRQVQLIPARYNTKTELRFTVESKSPVEHDFELK